MRFYKVSILAFVALVITGCATPEKIGSTAEELTALENMAKRLHLDLGKIEKRGTEKNMVGLRSQYVLFSKRLDSRTYFVQDDRYANNDQGVFLGTDEELIHLSRQVMDELAIPLQEIYNPVVMTEKLQTARYDSESKAYVRSGVQTGKRFVEVSREVNGIPVFSSRGIIGLGRDRKVGFLEIHWPQLSATTVREARRLQAIVRKDWKPPSQKNATVESVTAGIIHSPALGFVMDIYPVIRVIYVSEDRTIGRKPVLYLDENGKRVSVPRIFEKSDEQPMGERKY